MFYQWLYSFADQISVLNIFKYITVRSFISFFNAFLLCWILGPYFINRLIIKQTSQSIRDDGPATHQKKFGTPTMGGGLILFCILIPCLLWVETKNSLVWGTLLITFGFGLIGYIDDYLKVVKKNAKGLSGKLRLFLEFFLSFLVIGILIKFFNLSTEIYIPFFKNINVDLKLWYLPFASIVIVGTANAVNLTDGLDGLAIVPVMIVSTTLALFSYLAGHFALAEYLQIPFVSGAGELTPVAACVVAASMGFLWYNTYPAQVFMGDIGSLSLGGFIGMMAVVTKNELILLLLGGVFVVEALSVITQVISFKLTGKRIFRMAPIHHHFELNGLDETKIIVRFWIISILLAILSLSTLKLR